MFIYVLLLVNNKYYVGKTKNPEFRISSHFRSDGSEWTKKYKPKKLLKMYKNCDSYDEDKITLKYMSKYGIENVRGGSFCKLYLNRENKNTIEQMLKGTNDQCFKCGEKGHFANDCNNNTDSNDEEDIDNLKKEILQECKKYNNILDGNDLVYIFNKVGINYIKIQNIYGFCQLINQCDNLVSVFNYREGINYKHFVEGFFYIIENNIETCNDCDLVDCICQKCYKCGKKGHYSSRCYAKK
jgi:predicted GIY-YIG superfamily endonuclease